MKRWGLRFVHRSRTIFYRAVPNPLTFALLSRRGFAGTGPDSLAHLPEEEARPGCSPQPAGPRAPLAAASRVPPVTPAPAPPLPRCRRHSPSTGGWGWALVARAPSVVHCPAHAPRALDSRTNTADTHTPGEVLHHTHPDDTTLCSRANSTHSTCTIKLQPHMSSLLTFHPSVRRC